MWKVLLTLFSHRMLLLVLVYAAINSSTPPSESSDGIRAIQPTQKLSEAFLARVSASKEATAVLGLAETSYSQIFSSVKDPFLWAGAVLSRATGLSATLTVLILSNIFLLLFLWELYELVCQVALPEVAVDTCILAILWITSYELSLGSTLSMSCFLATLAIRHGFDNGWLISGLGLGLLALNRPFAILLAPLLIVVFWYYQRHFQIDQIIKRILFLALPIGAAIFLNRGLYENWRAIINDSALLTIVSAAQNGGNVSWVLSKSYLGQTVTIGVLLAGALTSILVYATFLHRILPLYLLAALMLSVSYGDIASAALLAAPALSGIAGASAPIMLRAIQGILLFFGSAEVFMVFR